MPTGMRTLWWLDLCLYTISGSCASPDSSQWQDCFSLFGWLWSLISVGSRVSVCSKCALVHLLGFGGSAFSEVFIDFSALVTCGHGHSEFGQTWFMA